MKRLKKKYLSFQNCELREEVGKLTVFLQAQLFVVKPGFPQLFHRLSLVVPVHGWEHLELWNDLLVRRKCAAPLITVRGLLQTQCNVRHPFSGVPFCQVHLPLLCRPRQLTRKRRVCMIRRGYTSSVRFCIRHSDSSSWLLSCWHLCLFY